MAKLLIDNLSKHYAAVKAVDGISLDIADGEFLTFLGPSGCGKSTTLFSIAGLDMPTGGRIVLDDQVFFDAEKKIAVPPEQRNCGLVFQSYALWPHLTVGQNLAFPLNLRKIDKPRQRQLIDRALELVEMSPYTARYPHELSGGQQQRVALARTLVYEPKLLLLDEPLSNLDAKLRIRARSWLKSLQSELGLTTIYVTHDQSEALSLSDRIAVIAEGKIVQLGTPEEIYRNPQSSFVADFIGASNFVRGTVVGIDGGAAAVQLPGDIRITAATSGEIQVGATVDVAVRPENIRQLNGGAVPADLNDITGTIKSREYLGSRFQYLVTFGDAELRMEVDREINEPQVRIGFAAADCRAFIHSH